MNFIAETVQDGNYRQDGICLAGKFPRRKSGQDKKDVENGKLHQVERFFYKSVDGCVRQLHDGIARQTGKDEDDDHISNRQQAQHPDEQSFQKITPKNE